MPNNDELQKLLEKALSDVPRIVNATIERAPGILLLEKTPEESGYLLESLVVSALYLGRAQIAIGLNIDQSTFSTDLHVDVEMKAAWHAGYSLGVSSLKPMHISLPPF